MGLTPFQNATCSHAYFLVQPSADPVQDDSSEKFADDKQQADWAIIADIVPGAVRFFTDEMACRIWEGRAGGTTYPSSFISYNGREAIIPPGLQDLSKEEQRQIMTVMEAAAADTVVPRPSRKETDYDGRSVASLLPSTSTAPHQQKPPAYVVDMHSRTLSELAGLPGLEELSPSEREKIIAVMEAARKDAEASHLDSTEPLRKTFFSASLTKEKVGNLPIKNQTKALVVVDKGKAITSTTPVKLVSPQPEQRKDLVVQSKTTTECDIIDGEQRKTSSADAMDSNIVSLPALSSADASWEKRSSKDAALEQKKPTEISYQDTVDDDLPAVDLSHLSQAEREQIRAVMRLAQMDDSDARRRQQSTRGQSPNIGHRISNTTHLSTKPTKPDVRQVEEVRDEGKLLCSVFGGPPLEENTPRKVECYRDEDEIKTLERKSQQFEPVSPTRESGYGTTSTSYDHELGDFATKTDQLYDLLDDTSEVREGAHSRNDSRADDRRDDFDFTYSDVRFAEITSENFDDEKYTVSVCNESGINVDAVEMNDSLYNRESADWSGARMPMWTTVFEGDESEQPSYDDVLQQHSSTDDESVFEDDSSDYVQKENEFDTALRPSSLRVAARSRTTTKSWTTMAIDASMVAPVARPTPEITITTDDERMDNEDEESGSDDDDDYPDKGVRLEYHATSVLTEYKGGRLKRLFWCYRCRARSGLHAYHGHVVAAPIAPTPTYEEVEQEREQQEQFGKEVLQQIQAFGEAADDEFDVQWAKSTLQKAQIRPHYECPFIEDEPCGTEISLPRAERHFPLLIRFRRNFVL
ncbi:unnamed protein product [Angiostrongylus costaricensis]|uniref:Mitotic interactor and substrate of PLK1 n=1 Tax=Angiostrongylus costaricensis TaxID=334426 RepID=A0A158PKB7_ANGCS|nr:unnamed protein product [Angiostrongylus costaricensis]